ncbi:MAG: TonB-dependent receptor [Pseudomonadota bacterium]
MRLGRLLLGAASIATLGCGQAWGQAPGQDDGGSLDEILVTARKTTERLQDTPISITAIDRDALERRGITSLAEVAKVTPGLNYGDFGDLKLSPTSLRGVVGSAGSAGADPAAGYYVDEVYVGQGPGANLDLYDIAQVEVLRGPQGTLYGRNTIGGVVAITTERPGDELKGSVTADFGNYRKQRLGASLSGPLVEGLVSAKLSAIVDHRDGYEYNMFLDRDVNNRKTWSGRAQLLFTPAPDTELLLTADHAEANQETLVFETLKYNPDALATQLLLASGFALNDDPFDRKVNANRVSRETLNADGYAANFRTVLGGVEIVDIFSYRQHDYYSFTDTCRCQLSFSYDGDPERVKRFSNEFRLSGKVGSLSLLAGVYYFHQKADNNSFIELGSTTADVFGVPEIDGLVIGSTGRMKTTSKAAFASATWAVDSRIDVTAGGRYTHDRKTIDYRQVDPFQILGGSTAITAKDSWGRFTPNANIRFRISPAVMTYLSAAKGFKSGGFNDALGDANGIAFGPETLWNYEAGVKAELFDRRVAVNLAFYAMEWDSIQITAQNPATTFFNPIILNAGKAHSRGVEIEATARVTSRLRLSGNLSVQDAAYDEGRLPNGQALDRIPFAPSYTALIEGEYTVPTALGPLSFQAEYQLRGRTYLTTNNDPDGRVGAYGLVNLRLALASDTDRWRIALYGKNVFDKTYMTRLFDLYDNTLNGQKLITLGAPATYGVEFKIAF